jgi:hypothetical protein
LSEIKALRRNIRSGSTRSGPGCSRLARRAGGFGAGGCGVHSFTWFKDRGTTGL